MKWSMECFVHDALRMICLFISLMDLLALYNCTHIFKIVINRRVRKRKNRWKGLVMLCLYIYYHVSK